MGVSSFKRTVQNHKRLETWVENILLDDVLCAGKGNFWKETRKPGVA